MNQIIKQCIGIDCSKDELDVCFAQLDTEWQIHHKAIKKFKNTPQGFGSFVKWFSKLINAEIPVVFTIEATGVYHERITHYLFERGQKISVILPNKSRHFAQTLKIRTVNDKESSIMLASFGLEKKLDAWQKPNPEFAQMKKLTREREQLMNELTINRNVLHAEEHSAMISASTISRIKSRVSLLKEQIYEIEQEVQEIIQSNVVLLEKITNICTIKGVGLITAVTVIAETDGFNLIRNNRQLVSYAGYDIVEKSSGTSVRTKPRISGKGNKHIRRALHFPAINCVKWNEPHQNFYKRLESKHGIKMKAYTAVQRKLLVLIYTLWKKNEPYMNMMDAHKKIEQPKMTTLSELDLVRS